jgi:hypothetical protein
LSISTEEEVVALPNVFVLEVITFAFSRRAKCVI